MNTQTLTQQNRDDLARLYYYSYQENKCFTLLLLIALAEKDPELQESIDRLGQQYINQKIPPLSLEEAERIKVLIDQHAKGENQ